MPVVTATEVTVYSNISASVTSIIDSGIIPLVQEAINLITNNYFVGDIYLQSTVTFDATARTILANSSFESAGFSAGDEIFICGSYRNDGYQTVLSISDETLTLATGSTIYSELSGASVLMTLVKWPLQLKQIAAVMVAYDLEVRPKRSSGIKSVSLGPWSESYGEEAKDDYGYPKSITNRLSSLSIGRFF